jgi:uncharacterized protein with FMN-binding domain
MDYMKKISCLLPYMPLAAAFFVAVCAGVSVITYKAPVYAIEENTASAEEGEKEASDRKAETAAQETSPEVTIPAVEEGRSLTDGEYEGSGSGFSGTVKVKVTIAGGKISGIDVVEAADEDPWFGNAKTLLGKIIDAQSTNVEAVSGATYSSRGIIEAVRDALDKAAGGEGTFDPEKATTAAVKTQAKGASRSVSKVSEPASYKDGSYTGSATGFGGRLSVKVTVSGGKISAIEVTSHNETSSYFAKAKSVINRMISGQSTNVDTVSGATYSSAGLINAVRNALSKAGGGSSSGTESYETLPQTAQRETEPTSPAETLDEKDGWVDGTYTGTAEGFVDDITVEVIVEGGRISSIRVVSQDETPEFYEKAVALIDLMIASQSTNVDAVSGATYSSEGIIGAVRDALKDAVIRQTESEPSLETGPSTETGPSLEPGSSSYEEPASGTEPGSGTEQPAEDGSRSGQDAPLPTEPTQIDDTSSDGGEPAGQDQTGSSEADPGTRPAHVPGEEPASDTGENGETKPGSGDSPAAVTQPHFKSGTYTVKVVCEPDEYEDFDPYNLIVDVKIENDVISAVENVSGDGAKSNQRYIKKAASGLQDQLINRNDISGEDGIDAVSGATCTSIAIARACARALEQARS